LAAKYGELEIMRVLLAHGADPRRVAKDGSSAILAAVTAKRPGQIGLLWDRRDRTLTPTELAAVPDNEDERITLEVVALACESGVDPNVAAHEVGDPRHLTGQDGGTPLTEAATRGYANVVQLLLDHALTSTRLPRPAILRCISQHKVVTTRSSAFWSPRVLISRLRTGEG